MLPRRLGCWLVGCLVGWLASAACSPVATSSSPDAAFRHASDAGPGTGVRDGSVTEGGATIPNDAGALLTKLGVATQTIGANGGTLALGAASLVVPAGALSQDVAISITATSVQAPGAASAATAYWFTPEGLTFAVPATVNLPAASGVVHWSQVEGALAAFTELPTTLAAGLATASVTHFSGAYTGDPVANGDVLVCVPAVPPQPPQPMCPTGYHCPPGGCMPDLEVVCDADLYMLFPYWCVPNPDAGSADGSAPLQDASIAPHEGGAPQDGSASADGSLPLADAGPGCGDASGAAVCAGGGCGGCALIGSSCINGHTYAVSCACNGSCTCLVDGVVTTTVPFACGVNSCSAIFTGCGFP